MTPDDVSPLVPFPDRVITGRAEILAYAGLLRWARLTEQQILSKLLAKYGDGSITESDPARPWSKQDFVKIAREMGTKPLTRFIPTPPMPTITRVRRRPAVLIRNGVEA